MDINEKKLTEENMKKLLYLSKEIMMMEKQKLVSRFSYLLPAIAALEFKPFVGERINTMGTNGIILYYNPFYVVDIYKINPIYVQTIILHEIFHCMFKHFLRGKSKDHELWNISTDIAINYIIKDLNECIKATSKDKEDVLLFPNGGGVENDIDKNKDMVNLNAETIYSYLVSQIKKAFEGKPSVFSVVLDGDNNNDGHGNITIDLDKIGVKSSKQNKEISDNISKKLGKMKQNAQMGNHDLWEKDSKEEQKDNKEKKVNHNNMDEKWTRINKEIQITRDMTPGVIGGSMSEKIDELNDGVVDWKETIKNMVNSMKESEKEDVNTIDYRYLASTGFYESDYNGDKKVINDFVIAIDTSGSINIPVFKAFLSETVNIFKTIRSETMSVNFYVIQCDTRVTDVKHIRRLNNIEELLGLEIKGRGGTNFVPIFDKVDDLIKQKLLKKLKGIIVFTDGFGTFPKRIPSYETLWVFADKHHIDKNKLPFGSYSIINDENI